MTGKGWETVAHDACDQSLSEHGLPLEAQVRTLNAIVNHLLDCVVRAEGKADANAARISRAMALARSAEALAGQARADARKAAREELLRVAAAAGDGGQAPRHAATPKRDRHGLRVIPGGLAAVTALAAIGRWSWRSGAHRAFATATLLAATGATAVAPELLAPAPHPRPVPAVAHAHPGQPAGAPAPFTAPAAHHRRCRDRDAVAVMAAGVVRCRDRDASAGSAARVPSPRPSTGTTLPASTPPGISPPAPTVPLPTPALPVPTPSATGPGGLVCQLLPPPCPPGPAGL